MDPSTATFEGVSGSLIVSVVAFTLVFVVLIGLTAVIYAIKLFSGEPSKPKQAAAPQAAAPSAPAPGAGRVASTTVVPAPVSSGSAKITAAITAAILAATQGRGRIVSVMPEPKKAPLDWTHTWRVSGRLERLSSRLVRTWKH
ncbi:MAG: sodium pump decarboxylase subunit gamma [Fretibacterium sp.]|nr:sodium pump decarboxylase subunit gamma [Fretibacterium sp.]